jgi:tetratricopeptide (TPR) repeat protein
MKIKRQKAQVKRQKNGTRPSDRTFHPPPLPFDFLRRLLLLFSLLISGATVRLAQEPIDVPVRSQRYNEIVRLVSQRQHAKAAEECKALIESEPGFSKPYSKLVTIAAKTGQLERARSYFEQLSVTNSRAFYSLGLIHSENKNYEAAVENHLNCLRSLPAFLPAVIALGDAALALKKPDAAEGFLRSQPNEASFVLGLGHLERMRGRHDAALTLFERSLQLNPQLIEAKQEKAVLFQAMGRSGEALALCEALYRELNEEADLEKKLHVLDFKVMLNDDLAQNLIDLHEALRVARKYRLSSSEESYLSQIGTTYWRMNWYSRALGYYQDALTLSRAGDGRTISFRFGNLGLAYGGLGDLRKAAEAYRQAIDAARAATPLERRSLINYLINLSEISPEIGEAEQAPALLEEAARILGASREASFTYRLQAGWASFHAHRQDFAESLKYNLAALQIARETKDLIKQGACLYRIGHCHLRLNRQAEAIAAYEEAAKIARRIHAPSILWKAEAGLARSRQEEHPGQALVHYRQAIEAIENTRGQQAGLEERIGFFQDKTDVYVHAVRLLLSRHRHDPAKKYDAEAFHLAERARARSLLDALGETIASLTLNLEKPLRDRQQEIQKRLSLAEARLVKAMEGNAASAMDIEKLEADLRQAVNEYNDWRQDVRRRNPHIAEIALPAPLTLEQVQDFLKSDG